MHENQEKLSFANFTNLGDYYTLEQSAIPLLPFTEKPLIGYSIATELNGKHFKSTISAGIYTEGVTRWLKEYAIRKKIFIALHGNAYASTTDQHQLDIDAGILSGELDCITTPNAQGITPIEHFATEGDIDEVSLRTLLNFPLTVPTLPKNPGFASERHRKVHDLFQKKRKEKNLLTHLHSYCDYYENRLLRNIASYSVDVEPLLLEKHIGNKLALLSELRCVLNQQAEKPPTVLIKALDKYQAVLELHQLLDPQKTVYEQMESFFAGFESGLHHNPQTQGFFNNSAVSKSRLDILTMQRNTHTDIFLKGIASVAAVISIVGIVFLPKIWRVAGNEFIHNVKKIKEESPYNFEPI